MPQSPKIQAGNEASGLIVGKITFDPTKFVYTVKDGKMHMNNKALSIKGANWAGFENAEMLHSGHYITKFTVEYGMKFLHDNGFNALRVPVSAEFMQYLENPQVKVGKTSATVAKKANHLGETTLEGKPVELAFRHFLNLAWKYGMLVLVDLHLFVAGWWDRKALKMRGGNTFKDNGPMTLAQPTSTEYANQTTNLDVSKLPAAEVVKTFPEATVAKLWGKFAKYCAQFPHVFAFDVKNEPNGKNGNPKINWTDYIATCKVYGDAILAANPNGIVFVEGLDESSTAAGPVNWGGALSDVGSIGGVKLATPNKLVYSPHIYGFAAETRDEAKSWTPNWGYLQAKKECLCIGEWGGKTKEAGEKKFMDDMAAYIAKNKLDSFHWCFNGNSGDTGGFLDPANTWTDDSPTWDVVDKEKLKIVADAHKSPTDVMKIFKDSGATYA